MADIKINPKDLKDLQSKLNKLKDIDSRKLGNEIALSGTKITLRAKRAIAGSGFDHSRGGLMSGQKDIYNRSKKTVDIVNDTPYSPYIEFGTRFKTIKLDDMLKLGISPQYAAQFKANPLKKPTNITAKPFFFGSVRIEFQKLLNRLDRIIKDSIS